MSEVSIFGKKWIDLVFEGRNKSYGAYQLRNENPRTTLTALFFGVLLMGSLGGGALLLSSFGEKPTPAIPDVPPVIVTLTDITPPAFEPPAPEKTVTAPAKEPDAKKLVNPVVVTPDQTPDAVVPNKEPVENPAVPTVGSLTGTSTTTSAPGGSNTAAVLPSDSPYLTGTLDVMPKFPGGLEKFYRYVGTNFRKPALESSKSLTVRVSFIIETDGTLSDIKVIQNPGNGLDKEAIRLLKALKTKWEPGVKNGIKVRTLYTLPITIVADY